MSIFQSPYDQSYPPELWAPVIPATGASFGTPGTFTPQGAETPANRAALASVTATPLTAWGVGGYVVTADAAESYWNGTAWVAGRATSVAKAAAAKAQPPKAAPPPPRKGPK